MASSITYNGVDSVEGGNIFKGIKFHVANRVPTRKTILDNIEVYFPPPRLRVKLTVKE